MDWVDATFVAAILAYAAVAVWFVRQSKKNNPQDYTNKHILEIELWIISIFIITAMQKVTILIAR